MNYSRCLSQAGSVRDSISQNLKSVRSATQTVSNVREEKRYIFNGPIVKPLWFNGDVGYILRL